jgi:hypothetical protein
VELRDFLVTPLLLIIIYAGAWLICPYVTDPITKRYFFSGLTVRIIGAVALGIIYQFYYGGGDTFTYHTHGSRIIWGAFSDSIESGFKILFSDGHPDPSIYKYSEKIYFYRDPASFFIVRLAAFFDLLTYSSYSATAIIFSIIGFIGSWMFFLTFYHQFPHLHRPLAWASLFIPSVIFWGSGLLKDTITLACLGIATFQISKIFIQKKFGIPSLLLLIISLLIIFTVKKFILQAFLPSAIIWIFATRWGSVRSTLVRVLVFPGLILTIALLSWYAAVKVGEGDDRYALDKIAKTARVTAYDIRYWSGRAAGSGYSLGELDDSFTGLLRLAPQAVNVSLFRPYLWEVNNPLMLMSAIESFILLLFCLLILVRSRLRLRAVYTNPTVLFCLVFSIVYAFAVGVSTFNFGTLARYKIAMLPFLLTALVLLYYSKSLRKEDVLDVTE